LHARTGFVIWRFQRFQQSANRAVQPEHHGQDQHDRKNNTLSPPVFLIEKISRKHTQERGYADGQAHVAGKPDATHQVPDIIFFKSVHPAPYTSWYKPFRTSDALLRQGGTRHLLPDAQ